MAIGNVKRHKMRQWNDWQFCAWSTDGKWNTSDFALLGFINSAKGDNMANISAVKKNL